MHSHKQTRLLSAHIARIHTAPAREIAARQIGNIQCNIDRLSIVGDLAGLQKTLKTLTTQTAE